MFVLSCVMPPEKGAKYGKTQFIISGLPTKRAALDHVAVALERSGVDRDCVQQICFEMERADTGTAKTLKDGRTICIDPEDRAPNACPCCRRLVKFGDHALAGSDDAYCLGCFTWKRGMDPCMPENTAHGIHDDNEES